jgi:hypothetical protein
VAEAGKIRPGDIIALVGFGGGLTWGATVLEWTAQPARPTYSITWGRRQGEYALAGVRRPLVRWWRRLMLLSPATFIRLARRWLTGQRGGGEDPESPGGEKKP